MSRLTTMIEREGDSHRMTPNSVRMIYIIRGARKAAASAILDWMDNYKHVHFQGQGLRGINLMLRKGKPWEAIDEQVRLGN